MNVLSLCDGMSCCHIALDRVGIPVEKYYAAEIKEIGIKVTRANYPDTIHIGDVNRISYKDGVLHTENGDFRQNFDLVAFGSPCQSFSQAMKTNMRIGLEDKIRSGLFLECYRILKEVNPRYFLLENVASMKNEDRDFLTSCMGVEPIQINSSLVSGALRNRLYWTNIPNVTVPEDRHILLQDILTSGFTDREKARVLLASDSRPLADRNRMLHRYKDSGFTTIVWEKDHDWLNNPPVGNIRYLNQTGLERCQTVPEGYTKCLTRNQAADVLGDGWTIDIIAHIFKNLKEDRVHVSVMA